MELRLDHIVKSRIFLRAQFHLCVMHITVLKAHRVHFNTQDDQIRGYNPINL